jgi:DNA polymerase III delta prime subunit
MLKNDLSRGRLPQTLLFHGPPSSGKFFTALHLARYLSCTSGSYDDGCSCRACRAVLQLQAPNLLLLSKTDLFPTFELWQRYGVSHDNLKLFLRDARRLLADIEDDQRLSREAERIADLISGLSKGEGEIEEQAGEIIERALAIFSAPAGRVLGIERVRQAQRFLSLKSDWGIRLLIVDGAESMTEEATNSFLKTAEDTPAQARIIIIAVDKTAVKETVVSRCRSYRFVRLGSGTRREVLRQMGFEPETGAGGGGSSGFVPGGGVQDEMSGMVEELYRLSDDPFGAWSLIRELAAGNRVMDLLDHLTGELRRAVHATGSPARVSELGAALKKVSSLKRGIRFHHLNVETALTDFWLNSFRKIVHLTKEMTH